MVYDRRKVQETYNVQEEYRRWIEGRQTRCAIPPAAPDKPRGRADLESV